MTYKRAKYVKRLFNITEKGITEKGLMKYGKLRSKGFNREKAIEELIKQDKILIKLLIN